MSRLTGQWVLAWAITSAVGSAAVYAAAIRPDAIAAARVLVVRKVPAGTAMQHLAEDYMSTNAAILTSQLIAEMAAKNADVTRVMNAGGFRSFPQVKEATDLVPVILERLRVSREGAGNAGKVSDNVLALTFHAADQSEARLILTAVLDSYQRFIDETYRDISEAQLANIQRARSAIEERIEAEDRKYEEFLKTHLDAPVGKDAAVVNATADALTQRIAENDVKAQALDGQIQNLDQAMKRPELAPAVNAKAAAWAAKAGLDKSQGTPEVLLAFLRLERSECESVAKSYAAALEKARRKQHDALSFQRNEEKLVSSRRRARETYNQFMKMVSELETRRDAGGFVTRVITKP